jgi:hypothetical protein
MSEIPPKGTTTVDVTAGLCLGALTGLLVGLTTASVTTTVLASVLAVATAFIGLAGETKFLDGVVNHARVASFAGAMACALLAGIWMRTHQTLSPSVEDLYIQLKTADFSEAEAKDVVRFVKFGLVPAGATVATGDQAAIVTGWNGTLFNGAPSWCDDFRLRQSQPVDDQVAWLQGQEEARDIASRMSNLPPERRAEVAGEALFYLCGINE